MKSVTFLKDGIEKAGNSLKTVAMLLNQSFEVESLTVNDWETVSRNLRDIGKGRPSASFLNDGNGWNGDTHHDGSLAYYQEVSNLRVHGSETSTSPLFSTSYADLKAECQRLYDTYEQATGGHFHTNQGSCHVHNSLSYGSVRNENNFHEHVSLIDMDTRKIVPNIAIFMMKFMPVMKWLSMTCERGARYVNGSRYDRLSNDALFEWYRGYRDDIEGDSSLYELYEMGRSSYFRLMCNPTSAKHLHWENRMLDVTGSPTHMAMWITINKAITLLAIDFARNDKFLDHRQVEMDSVQGMMETFKYNFHGSHGIKHSKGMIESMGKQMIGYLGKYFKILGSMDVIGVIEKLIEKPIPAYLKEKGISDNYNLNKSEGVFNTRNRVGDIELRNKFMDVLKGMYVPANNSLAEHQEAIASYIGVEVRKVKSLYQMLKRENVDIEFIAGRLVFMGD